MITANDVRDIITKSPFIVSEIVSEEESRIGMPDRITGFYLHSIAYGSCALSFVCGVAWGWPDEVKVVPDMIPWALQSICKELDDMTVEKTPALLEDQDWLSFVARIVSPESLREWKRSRGGLCRTVLFDTWSSQCTAQYAL